MHAAFTCVRLTALALGLSALFTPALSQVQPASTWSRSPDPFAPMGHCASESSAMQTKWWMVENVGESTHGILALQVLSCRPFSGGGVSKVNCSAAGAGGVPYAFCVRSLNDGLGNEVQLGVLRRDAVSDANGLYTGCPGGAAPQPKLDLLRAAGIDARRVSGVVTMACGAATGSQSVVPVQIDCPSRPNPYGECIHTPNDGHGNSVSLGIVRAFGPGDPNGLYGECDGASTGIRPGYLYKSDVLTQVGRSADTVRAMDLLSCAVPWGMGPWLPPSFEVWDCGRVPYLPATLQARYTYCVVGTDEKGSGAVFGVSGK